MQLGFVSACMYDLSLEDVFKFAADEGFGCVELMCWPPGAGDRRYSGVTHVDVTRFNEDEIGRIKDLVKKHGVAISGLGYYPNPLHGEEKHRLFVIDHLKRVISAAPRLDVSVVNTFIGRDPDKTIEDNWPVLQEVWPELIHHAESEKVKLAIEHCPMLYSTDEWPGGKNLAMSPATFRAVFEELGSLSLGLNFDPSHLVWLGIDCARCVREFGNRIFHAHAKDTIIDRDKLYEQGILGLGWHSDKLPGLGEVNWGAYFAALSDVGYRGAVCIEHEDRAFEESRDDRKRGLRQSKRFLEQFVS
ncbi:MAG: sugar phosphate isomerase/epimerase family protein [Gemmataceae bacterium]